MIVVGCMSALGDRNILESVTALFDDKKSK